MRYVVPCPLKRVDSAGHSPGTGRRLFSEPMLMPRGCITCSLSLPDDAEPTVRHELTRVCERQSQHVSGSCGRLDPRLSGGGCGPIRVKSNDARLVRLAFLPLLPSAGPASVFKCRGSIRRRRPGDGQFDLSRGDDNDDRNRKVVQRPKRLRLHPARGRVEGCLCAHLSGRTVRHGAPERGTARKLRS